MQFEAVSHKEQEDCYVFYGVDGGASTFFLKNKGVSAIMEEKLADSQEKSHKKLFKNFLRNKR
ncbi:MAG: hypothetical protein HOP34_08355 [Methylococcaceae bacterium]|nr:hypothetical protein [Methylococcaceae bacterium]